MVQRYVRNELSVEGAICVSESLRERLCALQVHRLMEESKGVDLAIANLHSMHWA
jgi:hypothetical protein